MQINLLWKLTLNEHSQPVKHCTIYMIPKTCVKGNVKYNWNCAQEYEQSLQWHYDIISEKSVVSSQTSTKDWRGLQHSISALPNPFSCKWNEICLNQQKIGIFGDWMIMRVLLWCEFVHIVSLFFRCFSTNFEQLLTEKQVVLFIFLSFLVVF